MRTTNLLAHGAAAAAVALLACTSVISALAADCPELVGYAPGGSFTSVAVSGDYAYVVGDEGLSVIDVSTPSHPREVGSVRTPGYGRDVAASGDYAYVAGYDYDHRASGLWVIDVSTPSAPVQVAFLEGPGAASANVAVSGGYAYVAWSDGGFPAAGGLQIIDVSVPSAPVGVGSIDSPFGCYDLVVSGAYAYVTYYDSDSREAGLRVVDVSTPSAPVEVGSYADEPRVPGYYAADGVAISGDYVYVVQSVLHDGGSDDTLRVIDVSTPSAPVEVGFIEFHRHHFTGVAVSGNHAYVADAPWGLRVFDVSTPSALVEVGLVNTPGFAMDVAVSGDFAYVAARESGLRVIDVGTPEAPVEVGFVGWPSGNIAVSDGYAFVAGGDALTVIDVRTPSAPVAVVSFVLSSSLSDVAASGDYAYVAAGGLRVIDVSTPSAPVEVGFLEGIGRRVAIEGNYAYVVSLGLWVVDVSTPSAPAVVGSVFGPSGEGWTDVAVSGGYAYVTYYDNGSSATGLRVIDVSTPSAPAEVGSIDIPGANGVAVSGDYAYVTAWEAGLRVIDVSTPSAPVEVGSVYAPHTRHVAVSGTYAYVTYYDNGSSATGLRVIDVSVPSAPVMVGSYEALPTQWSEWDVAVADGYVYLPSDGLYIFSECTRPTADARESFIPAAAVAAGAQGAFFQTDVEVNNTGAEAAEVQFQWLPRGEDNSEPTQSEPIVLAPGQSLRYENVLAELFGLGPDSLGALKLVSSTESVIGMSRTYNVSGAKAAGTFGQGLPAVRAPEMIIGTEPRRIIFLSENDDSRANVGCVNGTSDPIRINIGIFNAEGTYLETRTMDLAPYSNNQINRVFRDWEPVNGYIDVGTDSHFALYTCYGSMLDNLTSDPTTILPQVPSADTTFIPAAALAAGLEGSFFQTDIDLNNAGSTDLTYKLLWLPRGVDNTEPVSSETFSLAPGAGVRYANVLGEVFGLEPDQVGALVVEASGIDLLAMSRTYNLPSAKVAGTFGQELPGIPADRMITTGERKRIIFMSENDDVRSNVGCINGAGIEVAVAIELYGSDGVKLETKYMMLPPYSNRQINGIFQDYAPINGYVDVRTYTPDVLIYCYGSVLDNLTSDPTTVLPQ